MERSLKVFLKPTKAAEVPVKPAQSPLQVLEAALYVGFEIVLTTLNVVDLITPHQGYERLDELVEGYNAKSIVDADHRTSSISVYEAGEFLSRDDTHLLHLDRPLQAAIYIGHLTLVGYNYCVLHNFLGDVRSLGLPVVV
ncbi:MAG: hypothetical protein KIH10_15110, partial [Candidatus Freyarchaeota archaeon]|nr:hypothetical protein [Candidatus Jordarchaeia archaeon]